jgi:hypothetical protein
MGIASRFRHDIVVSRWTEGTTTDSRGHRDDAWVDDDEPIRGWIQPRASREVETDETAGTALSDAIAYVGPNEVITDRDYLKEGSRVFEVVGPPRDAGGRGKHFEIDLLQVIP